MARKAEKTDHLPVSARRPTLAPAKKLVDHGDPITDVERALFTACFGKLVEQILAETD